MAASESDRNLLVGILALQMVFISRDALIKGMNAWVLAKSKPLGQILAEQGALTADLRNCVEAIPNPAARPGVTVLQAVRDPQVPP